MQTDKRKLPLNLKRLEVNKIEKKLNILMGVKRNADTEEFAFLAMLTLDKESPKYGLPANSPFPAIVKKTKDGKLAVFCCTNGKMEIIADDFQEPTPLGDIFQYRGYVYKKNPFMPVYHLKK